MILRPNQTLEQEIHKFCLTNLFHKILACAEVSYRVELSQAPFPNKMGTKSDVSKKEDNL